VESVRIASPRLNSSVAEGKYYARAEVCKNKTAETP
jgi:hypothetical protein